MNMFYRVKILLISFITSPLVLSASMESMGKNASEKAIKIGISFLLFATAVVGYKYYTNDQEARNSANNLIKGCLWLFGGGTIIATLKTMFS